MNLIVAVDKNWGIGINGDLLFSIPEDKKIFRHTTLNKVVVMGHSTFKSLPDSAPLKNRTNIVLSKDKTLKMEGAVVCNSIEQLMNTISAYDDNDVFVIGGQAVYAQLIDYCKTAYVTRIDSAVKADKYFPAIDKMDNWEIVNVSDKKEYDGLAFAFYQYQNNSPKV